MTVTPEEVQAAAHLGHDLPGLPFARLVAITTPKDWDGVLFKLRFESASQIAAEINAAAPQPPVKAQATIGRKRHPKALTAAAASGKPN